MAKFTRSAKSPTPPSVKHICRRIAKGVLASILVSIGCLLLISIITLFTDNNYIENHIQYMMIAVTLISIFVGSVCATCRTQSRGLIVGMTVGLLYVLLSITISFTLHQDNMIILILITKCLAGLGAGAMGGLVGVNL